MPMPRLVIPDIFNRESKRMPTPSLGPRETRPYDNREVGLAALIS